MNWSYLLEANLYLGLFYGCYRLFLAETTFYKLSRYYLIAAVLCAFLLPFFQLGIFTRLRNLPETLVEFRIAGETAASQNPAYSFAELCSSCYLVVTVILAILFLRNCYQLAVLYRRSKKEKKGNIYYMELEDNGTAFSFFNLLFIHPEAQKKEVIIRHELIHIRQKHSLDILFFELLKAINWINPISWLLLREIKMIHEYIADAETIHPNLEKHDYAILLITNSFGPIPNHLTNQIFNQTLLKRRIQMLNKEKTPDRAKLRLLLVLPLVTAMLCASSYAYTKDYAVVDLYPQKAGSNWQEPVKKVKAPGRPQTPPPLPPAPPVPPVPSTPPTPPAAPKRSKSSKVPTTPGLGHQNTPIIGNESTKNIYNGPLLINNGKIVETQGQKVTVTSFSGLTHTKSSPDAIKMYGDRAKNGITELIDGVIKLEPAPKRPY